MNQTVVKADRSAMLLLFLICVVFSVVVGWLTFGRPSKPPTTCDTVCRGPVVVLLLVFAVWYLHRAVKPQPALVLDDMGLLDNASLWSVGFLLWEDIVGVGVFSAGGQRFITLVVRDPEALLSRLSPVKRVWLIVYQFFGFPLVSIPGSALSDPIEEVVNLIIEHHPRPIEGSA